MSLLGWEDLIYWLPLYRHAIREAIADILGEP